MDWVAIKPATASAGWNLCDDFTASNALDTNWHLNDAKQLCKLNVKAGQLSFDCNNNTAEDLGAALQPSRFSKGTTGVAATVKVEKTGGPFQLSTRWICPESGLERAYHLELDTNVARATELYPQQGWRLVELGKISVAPDQPHVLQIERTRDSIKFLVDTQPLPLAIVPELSDCFSMSDWSFDFVVWKDGNSLKGQIEEVRYSVSASPSETPTAQPTRTATPPTLTPPPNSSIPPGYVVFDEFNGAGAPDGRWTFYGDPNACSFEQKDSYLWIQCKGKATENVQWGYCPLADSNKVVRGAAMAAQVVQPTTGFEAKIQLLVKFTGPDGTPSLRAYHTSLRGATAYVVESYPQEQWREVTLAEVRIAHPQVHVLRIEYDSKNLAFFFDNERIALQTQPNLPPNSTWESWAIEGFVFKPEGGTPEVLKGLVDWVAVWPAD